MSATINCGGGGAYLIRIGCAWQRHCMCMLIVDKSHNHAELPTFNDVQRGSGKLPWVTAGDGSVAGTSASSRTRSTKYSVSPKQDEGMNLCWW